MRQKIFGIIGDPVEHSLSPRMHQAAFQALGMVATFLKFPVKTHGLKSFLERMRQGEISGINVTTPYKQAVIPFLDDITELAQKTGAVNTIWVKDGKLTGDNTDGLGYVNSLLEETKIVLKNKTVVIIGAGGAARAIAFCLSEQCPKKIYCLNRRVEHAKHLTQAMSELYPTIQYEALGLAELNHIAPACDLLINTSTMGMKNTPWWDLCFVAKLPKHAVVSDIVYTPRLTPLLAAAQKCHLKTHDGLGMLAHQGALSFARFTGKKPPLSVLKNALVVKQG